MEIEILAHGNTSQSRIDLITKASKFYATHLNLNRFKYKVFICTAPNLRKNDGNNGIASHTGPNEVTICVDSKLNTGRLLFTLAHEMVHAKQYMYGHYRAEPARNGKLKRFWLGKQYSVEYMKRPWEREAFRRESELVYALFDHVAQKVKKQKSRT
jgi:hypothetical protein